MEEQNTFNVAVAELMAFSNLIRDSAHLVGSCVYHMALCTLCTLLAPMAPHIASEMWVELREAARQVQITSPQVCTQHLKLTAYIIHIGFTLVYEKLMANLFL